MYPTFLGASLVIKLTSMQHPHKNIIYFLSSTVTIPTEIEMTDGRIVSMSVSLTVIFIMLSLHDVHNHDDCGQVFMFKGYGS